MKKIYIVLTYTGTLLSKIVKIYTRKKYSHVSIALEKDLKNMYSFGRKNPYLLLPAGYVQEGINIGTFKRFKNTKAAIYSLEISDEQYNAIISIINDFNNNPNKYSFNIIGLFFAIFRIKLKRNKMYCAEFVKYVLDKSNINTNLPDCVRPNDFKHIKELELIYTGKLSNYNINT